jgi:hypothetical protein
MRVYKFLTAHFALKSLYERRLKVSTLDDLNDLFELTPFNLSDRVLRTATHAMKNQLAKKYGVLCFSAGWSDPVIWAHYSDKHRGICLGLSVPDDKCVPVDYQDARLDQPEQWELDSEASLKTMNRLLNTKYGNWRYEQEVRLWVNLKDSEDGLYYFDFDAELRLEEVILGANCTVPRTGIERACQHAPITIKKARAGFQRFEIVEDLRGPN